MTVGLGYQPTMCFGSIANQRSKVRFVTLEVFLLAGLLLDFKDLVISQRSRHSIHTLSKVSYVVYAYRFLHV